MKKQSPFYFNVRAANYRILLQSESYTTAQAAFGGMLSVLKNGGSRKNYEIRTAVNNQPYFVLKAPNHRIIGVSEMYSSQAACLKGISSMLKNYRHADLFLGKEYR